MEIQRNAESITRLHRAGGRGWDRGDKQVMVNRSGVWGIYEKILKLFVMKDAQLCKYTASHWFVCFKRVNCMARDLYLNKGI